MHFYYKLTIPNLYVFSLIIYEDPNLLSELSYAEDVLAHYVLSFHACRQ